MKKEELLIITLAIVIFVAMFITINPSVTGLTIYQLSNYTYNDNFMINETIQLKQHSYITANWTTEEIFYSNLTFAEKTEDNESNIIITDELQRLIELNDNQTNLGKDDLLKIRFNNILENNDKINLYLKSDKQSTLNICTFNAENSCNNQTIFASLNYSGQEGFYQVVLSLQEPTKEFILDSVEQAIKIDYINASYLAPVEHINRTYYYNSDSIETETIQPHNFEKWDIFTANYILDNQTIKFYYKTDSNYTEFTSPFNFSEIDSSSLKFKLDLFSDNLSTSIIYNLSINYLEIQEITFSGQAPSLTRYKSSIPLVTSTPTISETPIKTETRTLPVELKTALEPQGIIEIEESPNKIRIIGNTLAISYLSFLCLLLYRKRHKL